jgi:hypothetical protein
MDRNNSRKLDATVTPVTEAQTNLSHSGASVMDQYTVPKANKVGLALGHDRENILKKYYGAVLSKDRSLP